MIFRPRRGGESHRFVFWQVGLFFLAAGVWLGGLITSRPGFTGLAIVILIIALILGVIGRREQQ